MTTLQINKENFDLIKNGTKKTEYRHYSVFNKHRLCKKREDGKYIGDDEIKKIQLINGYSKDAPRIILQCLGVRLVRFVSNFESKEDNFIAKEGDCSIEIKLGEIIKIILILYFINFKFYNYEQIYF